MSENGKLLIFPAKTSDAASGEAPETQDKIASVTSITAKRTPTPLYKVTNPAVIASPATPRIFVPNPNIPLRPTPKENDQVGEMVIKGVFQGEWTPPGLERPLAVYSGPEDLMKTSPGKRGQKLQKAFGEAIKHVAHIKNYHGHPGFNHIVDDLTPEEALYQALRTKTYKGEWALAPLPVLNMLFDNRNRKSLFETFTTASDGTNTAHLYISCTSESPNFAKIKNFADGNTYGAQKDTTPASMRLVRFEYT